jgi:hypothetical protein
VRNAENPKRRKLADSRKGHGCVRNVGKRHLNRVPRTRPALEPVEHGIYCNCERCVGLRLYPEPSHCYSCQTIHPGNGHNCPKYLLDNGTENITIDWSEFDPLVEAATDFLIGELNQLREKFKKEFSQMLPTGNRSITTNKNPNAMVYLTNDHLSITPKSAKILAVRLDSEGKFGARVILKLAFDGKTLFWGVSCSLKNPNYTNLIQKFTADENEWVGQNILLSLEKDDFTDQYFSRVTFPKGK